MKISPYYKAAAGFIVGAATALVGASDGGVTAQEWLTVLVAGIAGSGLVYVAPKNREK